jgi:uncharacterized phage-like protein YoqJ
MKEIDMEKLPVVAGTGHRPDKLGGYSLAAHMDLVATARGWLEQHPVRGVISGMALGWDQALALAAADLGIPFMAAVPCDEQDRMWPAGSRRDYQRLLARAAKVLVVSPGPYAAWKMQTRNVWMVDRADIILAMWNGTSGGTANCIEYAKSRGKTITNLWNAKALQTA